MTTPFSFPLAPRLLAGSGTLTLLAGLGLFASRPAHTAGGPIAVSIANAPLAVTTSPERPVEVSIFMSTNTFDNLLYTVPAGKELVVKSMTLYGNGGQFYSYIGVVKNQDSAGSPRSFATLTAPPSANADVAAVTQPMSFTVAPGDQVGVDLLLRGGTLYTGAYVSLSGNLVDAP